MESIIQTTRSYGQQSKAAYEANEPSKDEELSRASVPSLRGTIVGGPGESCCARRHSIVRRVAIELPSHCRLRRAKHEERTP